MEARKTEIAMGIVLKVTYLESVGEEWKSDRMNWRLLAENVVREK